MELKIEIQSSSGSANNNNNDNNNCAGGDVSTNKAYMPKLMIVPRLLAKMAPGTNKSGSYGSS